MRNQKNIKPPSLENSTFNAFSRLLYSVVILCCFLFPLFKPSSSEIEKLDASISQGIVLWLGEDWLTYKDLVTETVYPYFQDSSEIQAQKQWKENVFYGFGNGFNALGACFQMVKAIQLNYFSPILTYSSILSLLLFSQLVMLLFTFQLRYILSFTFVSIILSLLIFFVAIRDAHFEPVNWGFISIVILLSLPLLFGTKNKEAN